MVGFSSNTVLTVSASALAEMPRCGLIQLKPANAVTSADIDAILFDVRQVRGSSSANHMRHGKCVTAQERCPSCYSESTDPSPRRHQRLSAPRRNSLLPSWKLVPRKRESPWQWRSNILGIRKPGACDRWPSRHIRVATRPDMRPVDTVHNFTSHGLPAYSSSKSTGTSPTTA